MEISRRVKELGHAAGFDIVRITSAQPLGTEGSRFGTWVGDGRQADMRWITPEYVERASNPSDALPSARSVICVAMRYWTVPRVAVEANKGRIARYAWGADYHTVLGERLETLASSLRAEVGGDYRWYVDTGPLMDKALAVRAGLGWYGKNTNILTPEFGSWVLLGEIVTTLDIEPDEATGGSCGSCRLCVVACPTGALGPEYSIDSRKCISYLTIEHRGSIPIEYREGMGSWVFGCDICQDVCPPSMETVIRDAKDRHGWTQELKSYLSHREPESWGDESRHERPSSPLQPGELRQSVDLIWLLGLNHEDYLQAFRGTSIRRAKVWMLRRNAAVALGNVGTSAALQPLTVAVESDEHPVVRSHAAWALGRLAERGIAALPKAALLSAYEREEDDEVRSELRNVVAIDASQYIARG